MNDDLENLDTSVWVLNSEIIDLVNHITLFYLVLLMYYFNVPITVFVRYGISAKEVGEE